MARCPRAANFRRSSGSRRSSSLAPKPSTRDSSYHFWATFTRSSITVRLLSSIETRAALWTTRLSATATSALTAAIARLTFQRSPERSASLTMSRVSP